MFTKKSRKNLKKKIITLAEDILFDTFTFLCHSINGEYQWKNIPGKNYKMKIYIILTILTRYTFKVFESLLNLIHLIRSAAYKPTTTYPETTNKSDITKFEAPPF